MPGCLEYLGSEYLISESNALQGPRGGAWEGLRSQHFTEEAVGEEIQEAEESIAGRTTDGEFHTFFDEKTFGMGEAGKAGACPRDTGLDNRVDRSPLALLCRLWPSASVRKEVEERQNGKGTSRLLHRWAHRGGLGR